MKKTYLILLITILSACNNSKDKKNISHSFVTTNQKKKPGDDSTEKFIKKDSIRNIQKDEKFKVNDLSLFLGFWGTPGEGNASFYIRKDSIYYEDNNTLYKYIVKSGRIKIFYDDGTESFRYKFSGNDTLTLTGTNGTSKFFRIKK